MKNILFTFVLMLSSFQLFAANPRVSEVVCETTRSSRATGFNSPTQRQEGDINRRINYLASQGKNVEVTDLVTAVSSGPDRYQTALTAIERTCVLVHYY